MPRKKGTWWTSQAARASEQTPTMIEKQGEGMGGNHFCLIRRSGANEEGSISSRSSERLCLLHGALFHSMFEEILT